MSNIVCLSGCSKVVCSVSEAANSFRINPADVAKFRLAPGVFTYLVLEDELGFEEMRYDGAISTDGVISVTRTSYRRAFRAGTTICGSRGCMFLAEYVKQVAVDSVAPEVNQDIRLGNNQWLGVNVFNNTVYMREAEWDSQNVASAELLKLSTGLHVDYESSIDDNLYGHLVTVSRRLGPSIKNTWGAKYVATALTGSDSTLVTGVDGQAWSQVGTQPQLMGVRAAVVVGDSTNTQQKVGLQAFFTNRPAGVGTANAGFGANRYNSNSIAFEIGSSSRSANGEFCGWNRGLVFSAGSLDETGTQDAVGIDFADVPTSEVPRYEAAIRLRASMKLEWNAGLGPYSRIQTSYIAAVDRLEFKKDTNLRLAVSMNNGMLEFGDVGTVDALVEPTAGSAAGLYLRIMYNGAPYKIALFNDV